MPLTAQQVAIVKSTAPVLKEHGETITRIFYKNLMNSYPDLRNIFNLSHQKNGAQSKALASAVLAYATHIDHPEVLLPTVERIAHKHVSLGVASDQYAIVGEQLIKAIGQVLGDGLTEDIADAWTAAYGQLADIFVQREGQLYAEAGEWQGWRKLKIMRREKEAKFITSFYLAPSDGKTPLPDFRPGQYVSLRIKVPELGDVYQCRQYSMSKAPHGDFYRVSVKRETATPGNSANLEPGVVSNLLHDHYHEGDEVEVSFPRGEFWLDIEDSTKASAPLILISAGVGITPLMSIMEGVLESPRSKMTNRPILWIHAARNSGEIAFGKHIRRLMAEHSNVDNVIFLKDLSQGDQRGQDYDVEGRLNLDLIHQTKHDVLHNDMSEFFICGPATWMAATRDKLESLGVAQDRINLELFGTGDIDSQL